MELAAKIILISSLIGMAIILFRKIPVLVELSEAQGADNLKENLLKLREKIKIFNPFKYFSDEIFLQKILSKIRVLTLRIENKTSGWLQKLREQAQKKKFGEHDNYWQKIKKSTKK